MIDFPALLDVTTNELHPLAGAVEYTAGRNPNLDLVLRDRACSRLQFRLHAAAGGYEIEPISRNSATYIDGKALEGRAPLRHGVAILAGNCRFRYLESVEGIDRTTLDPTILHTADATTPTPQGEPQSLEDVETIVLAQGKHRCSAATGTDRRSSCPTPRSPASMPRSPASGTRPSSSTSKCQRHVRQRPAGQRGDHDQPGRPDRHRPLRPAVQRHDADAPHPRRQRRAGRAAASRGWSTNRETGKPLDAAGRRHPGRSGRASSSACSGPAVRANRRCCRPSAAGRRPTRDGCCSTARICTPTSRRSSRTSPSCRRRTCCTIRCRVGQALWYTAQLRLPPDTSDAEIDDVAERDARDRRPDGPARPPSSATSAAGRSSAPAWPTRSCASRACCSSTR